jgi:glycosyltransferase involved in cell wall biosynthesis
MEKDLVSILLPAYNAEETISKSIESIFGQTYQEYELIIIDDGSTDKTEEIIKSYSSNPKIIYIKNEKNIGLIETLNKGIRVSKGEFLARIDADDIWISSNKLAKQVHFLNTVPECTLIGTQAKFTNGEKTSYPLTDQTIRKSILTKNLFIHSSVMFRKKSLNHSYDIKDYLVEDYSLWLKLGLEGTFANLEDYAVEYYINPQGETRKNNYLQTKNSLNLIKSYKHKYPNYYKALLIWTSKLVLRKIFGLFHLK